MTVRTSCCATERPREVRGELPDQEVDEAAHLRQQVPAVRVDGVDRQRLVAVMLGEQHQPPGLDRVADPEAGDPGDAEPASAIS